MGSITDSYVALMVCSLMLLYEVLLNYQRTIICTLNPKLYVYNIGVIV